MTKLNTIGILTTLLDVMEGEKEVSQMNPEQKAQIVSFLEKQTQLIAQKQKNAKAEKEKAQEMASTRKAQRKATSEEKINRIEKIKSFLLANPNLIVSAKELCEKVFNNELKSQALTRIIIDLESEGFVKVVGQKPKQIQKA